MKRFPIIAIAVASTAGANQPAEAHTSPSTINRIIAEFHDAIVAKDKGRFLALFLNPDRMTWQAVNGDRVLKQKRATAPATVKAESSPSATPAAFIDRVSSMAETAEEKFSNIRVNSDADSAAVSFNYTVLVGGRTRNTGREHWLLIRTDQGWRITAVSWSVETLNR